MLRIVVASVRMISPATKGEVRSKSQSRARGRRKSRLSRDHPNEHRTPVMSSRILIPPKNSPGPSVPRKISCSSKKNFSHAQLTFQHHVEITRRIAFANERLPCLTANLSSRRKTRTLGVVELSEKRDVEDCCEPSLRNGGRLRRRNDIPLRVAP